MSMARIILVTGGSRSGKSAYAQQIAEDRPAPRTYIATAPVIDDEMRERVRKHREARGKNRWRTVEETVDLAGSLRGAADSGVLLVDCLTLWVNNLLFEAEKRREVLTEESVIRECGTVLEACAGISGTVIFVTNEVGMGIVPDHPLSRLFRDLAGRCNQVMAEQADAVIFMVSGLPLPLKGGKPF
jgi:adenosylcobinamide kinase/adenosylcobinamide-phosphate guanylyltransferase